ncbi:MAG: alpha amylase C-terminal domain-containing protein, partial [Terrabacter sp.]
DAPVVACVMNFSGQTQESYRIGLPRGGRWTVVLDTAGYHPDAPSSAGIVVEARQESWHQQPYAADVTVPRLSTVWLVPVDEPVPAAADTIQGAVSDSSDATSQPPTTNGDPS